MPRMVRALGPCFYVCLFIGRKVTMGFISLTFRFVIKCQTLVRIVQTNHHFVHVAFLNLEIVQLSHCLALPACYPSLLSAHYGRVLLCQQPLSGTLSPINDNHGLPWMQRPGLESVVSLWACMPCPFQPCPGAGFEQAGRKTCGIASHPPLTQVG